MTREQAQSRINDLKADKAWVGRYLDGGSQEKREMLALMQIVADTGA